MSSVKSQMDINAGIVHNIELIRHKSVSYLIYNEFMDYINVGSELFNVFSLLNRKLLEVVDEKN